MTQSSMLWDGLSIGDAAILANYTALEFGAMLNRFMGGSGDVAFVIPGYLNELEPVTDVVANTMTIKSGAALVNGYLYTSDADVDLVFSAVGGAGEARIDVIVLEIDFSAQTVRLAIVEGTRATQPTFPTLTQDDSTWQAALAYCYLETGYSNIYEYDIHDLRQFAPTPEAFLQGGQTNLLENPEFGIFSEGSGSPLSSTNPPDRWSEVVTCTFTHEDKPSDYQTRGRAIILTAGDTDSGIGQTVAIKPSTFYCAKIYYKNPLTTDSMKFGVTTDGVSPLEMYRALKRYNEWIEETIFFTTPADATSLLLYVTADTAGDAPIISQAILVEGYLPGTLRPKQEFIPFDSSALVAANVEAIYELGAAYLLNSNSLFSTQVGWFNEAVLLRFLVEIVHSIDLGRFTEVGFGPEDLGHTYARYYTEINEDDALMSKQFACAFLGDTNNGKLDIGVNASGALVDHDTDTTLYATGVFT